ncbi:unnamed protein product [Urochloa decumbens]|uniref:non-specific serine/threonine protein kinase n=1 Tax=Urochloa decumbens TaxID=240449 RepID=A0ABC9G9S0_9POAL
MALWECMGKVANISGPVGLDTFKLISMIMNGVETVRRNHEECKQLSHFASTTEDLLHELANLKVIEHPKMWKPIQGLRGTLLQAYMLIKSCQHRSYASHFCAGGNLAAQLQSVQKEMDFNIRYLAALLNAINYSEITTVSGTADGIRNTDGGRALPHHGEAGSSPNNKGLPKRGLVEFAFSQLAEATNYFSLKNKIGFGAISTVYKGVLHHGLQIAFKRASYDGQIPCNYFENEINLIPKLKHTNIVTLLGYCTQKSERILILESMPNRSLDSFIYGDRAIKSPLDWPKRCQIVQGIAQGALYLHKLCRPRIIHGDLKRGNILLDSDLSPKICDFRISTTLKPGADVDCTRIVAGSRGFIVPEYKRGGCLSLKSHVYSFGVTMLQTISGKKAPPPPLALSDESRDYGPLNKWLCSGLGLMGSAKAMQFIDP